MIWYNNDDSSINITNQESCAKKYEKPLLLAILGYAIIFEIPYFFLWYRLSWETNWGTVFQITIYVLVFLFFMKKNR